jgi:uncharacterized protein YndB with AHSA1/START domain
MHVQQVIQASAAQVYRAFTMPTLLQLWLCSEAKATFREGSMFFYRWDRGFYAAGTFKTLDKDRHIAQTWRFSTQTAESLLDVTLTETDGATTVDLDYGGDDFTLDWTAALDHLRYLLEVGFDQRLMQRPMLGIYPSELDEARAAKLGISGIKGTHIDNVLEGMGAATVLQAGDVLVTVNGIPVHDFVSLSQAVAPFKGGDVVQIEFYRAGQKHSADLPLSKRPVPELPATPSALSEVMRSNLEAISGELDALLAGVPEDALSRRPEPSEWSANENLAHLIWTARNNQSWLFNMVGGDDSVIWMDNNDLHLILSTSIYPTSADLAAEFKRAEAALIAQVEALPAWLVNNKGLMSYVGQNLTNTHLHTREHFEQMRRAIAAVQQPTP